MKRSSNRGQWVVRVLCALALLFVGFAHQPVAVAENAPFDISSYKLPDGTLPILCVTENDGAQKDKDKHVHTQGCEACRISASALLPQPADDVGQVVRLASAMPLLPPLRIEPRRIFSPATAPRAPPLA